LTVVLVAEPAPDAFDGVTEYDVFTDGAVMLTEHDVDAIPPLHRQDVNGLPAPQVTARFTAVPGATALEAVFGV
jgi:hypothetical protein